jgi:hypothetical protein
VEPRHGHRVVAAALRLTDGTVIVGVRHLDALMIAQLDRMGISEGRQIVGHEQGFVDNKYQFLTREEAYRVALAAYQFDPNGPEYTGIRGCLFSEDVW